MKRTHIALILASAVAVATLPSFAADSKSTDSSKTLTQKARELVKSDFAKADKDNDGTLDKSEAAVMPNVSTNFVAMDTDADGTVSKDEVKTYEKFAKADKDGNGTLDKAESRFWLTVSRNFDAIDTNSEGTVSLKEINAYMVAKEKHASNTK